MLMTPVTSTTRPSRSLTRLSSDAYRESETQRDVCQRSWSSLVAHRFLSSCRNETHPLNVMVCPSNAWGAAATSRNSGSAFVACRDGAIEEQARMANEQQNAIGLRRRRVLMVLADGRFLLADRIRSLPACSCGFPGAPRVTTRGCRYVALGTYRQAAASAQQRGEATCGKRRLILARQASRTLPCHATILKTSKAVTALPLLYWQLVQPGVILAAPPRTGGRGSKSR